MTGFDFLAPADLAEDETRRIAHEIQRYYPQVSDPRIEAAHQLPFYPGYVLLAVRADDPGDAPPYWCVADLAAAQAWIVDPQGTAIERIDRVAPLVLSSDRQAADYVRFRLAFLHDRRHKRRFSLAGPSDQAITAIPENGGFTVQVQLFDQADLQKPRAASARIFVRPGSGIVFAQPESGWRETVEGIAPADARAVHRGVSLARVATPHFVDAWPTKWIPPARSRGGLDDTPSVEAIPEPYANLLDGFGIGEEERDRSQVIVRSIPLPFYRTFRLFETIVANADGTAQTGYCLGRLRQTGKGWEFHWLNGSSAPIHGANEAVLADGSTEIDLDPAAPQDEAGDAAGDAAGDRVAAYIRFFCWAVEGDEGPFFAPDRLHRIELTEAMPASVASAIDDSGLLERMRDTGRHPGSDTEEATFRREALLIYGSTVFRAEFAVSPSGKIGMVDDEALQAPVAPEVRSLRAPPHRVWNGATAPPPVASPPSDETPTAPPPDRVRAPRIENGAEIFEGYDFDSAPSIASLANPAHDRVFRGCRFRSGLSLQGKKLASVHFEGCIFEPIPDQPGVAVDLSGVNATGSVRFVDCQMQGSLRAVQADVGGELEVLACTLAKQVADAAFRRVPQMKAGGTESFQNVSNVLVQDRCDIDFSGISVGGSLVIGAARQNAGNWIRTLVTGAITLPRARVGRDLRFSGLWCHQLIDVGSARVGQVCIFGNDGEGTIDDGTSEGCTCLDVQAIAASSLVCEEAGFSHLRLGDQAVPVAGRGYVDLSHARIGKYLRFFRAELGGRLTLRAVDIDGDVLFTQTRVGETIDLAFASIRRFFGTGSRNSAYLSEYLLRCGGDIVFSGATIGGIELSGAEIEGRFEFITGTLGCLYVLPALVLRKDGRIDVATTRMRGLAMRNVTVEDDVRLHSIRVGGLPGMLFKRFVRWLDQPDRIGIQIENSTVGGHFTTLPEHRSLAESFRLDHEELDRSIPAVRSFLDQLEDEEHGARPRTERIVGGDVLLRANRFEGSLHLRDLCVFGRLIVADSEIDIDFNLESNQPTTRGIQRGLQTQCVEADFEKILCKGDVNLTGLFVRTLLDAPKGRGSELPIWATGNGRLNLRDADIKGDLLLVQEAVGSDASASSHARVEGQLDLSAVKASKLALTGENLTNAESSVVLERAQLSRLEIIRPTPSTIDLTAIKVERWCFGHQDAASHWTDPTAKDYIDVLSKMEPVDRGVWIAVESSLRNQGLDASANEIYRAMRTQGRRHLSRVRKAFDSLSCMTLSYGTRPWRPLLPLLLCFAVLAVLFSQSENVAPTSDLIQASGGDCRSLLPPDLTLPASGPMHPAVPSCEQLTPVLLGYSWSAVDGLYLALRHTVPVIDVLSHEDWKAAHRPIALPAWTGRSTRIRMDALASLVSLYAWIAVPISLLFFGTKVFRKSRE